MVSAARRGYLSGDLVQHPLSVKWSEGKGLLIRSVECRHGLILSWSRTHLHLYTVEIMSLPSSLGVPGRHACPSHPTTTRVTQDTLSHEPHTLWELRPRECCISSLMFQVNVSYLHLREVSSRIWIIISLPLEKPVNWILHRFKEIY